MRERGPGLILAAVILQIPYELRYTLFGLTNLQWTFIVLVGVSIPLLYRTADSLCRDRMVQVAAAFMLLQWMAAAYAPEFNANAVRAAVRFSAGFVLFAIARCLDKRDTVLKVFALTAFGAALYAIADYAGAGVPELFRNREFFIAQIARLSGSFEYPNSAAAFFCTVVAFGVVAALETSRKNLSNGHRMLRVASDFFARSGSCSSCRLLDRVASEAATKHTHGSGLGSGWFDGVRRHTGVQPVST